MILETLEPFLDPLITYSFIDLIVPFPLLKGNTF